MFLCIGPVGIYFDQLDFIKWLVHCILGVQQGTGRNLVCLGASFSGPLSGHASWLSSKVRYAMRKSLFRLL